MPPLLRIYNEGTRSRRYLRNPFAHREDIRAWFDGVHPIVVVEDQGVSLLWRDIRLPPARCYAGIAEASLTWRRRTPQRRGTLTRSR
jgi:hypothetical protein